MKVQIIKSWGVGPIGRYQEVQPNVGTTLIRRGIAIALSPAKPPASQKPKRKGVKPQ